MEDNNLARTLNKFNKTTNLTLEEFEKKYQEKWQSIYYQMN